MKATPTHTSLAECFIRLAHIRSIGCGSVSVACRKRWSAVVRVCVLMIPHWRALHRRLAAGRAGLSRDDQTGGSYESTVTQWPSSARSSEDRPANFRAAPTTPSRPGDQLGADQKVQRGVFGLHVEARTRDECYLCCCRREAVSRMHCNEPVCRLLLA